MEVNLVLCLTIVFVSAAGENTTSKDITTGVPTVSVNRISTGLTTNIHKSTINIQTTENSTLLITKTGTNAQQKVVTSQKDTTRASNTTNSPRISQTAPIQSSFNSFLGRVVNGVNSILQNISQQSARGNPNSGNLLSNISFVTSLLGNFLPKKAQDILSVISKNQSALTVQNLAGIAVPLIQSIGAQTLRGLGVSKTCSSDINLLMNGLQAQEEWTYKMVDATFKIPADLYGTVMSGSPKLLGGYDECLGISGIAGNTGHEVQGQYCKATTHIDLPQQALSVNGGLATFGLCVSKSCSSSDISLLIDSIQKQIFNGTVKYKLAVDCVEKKKWETDMIIVTCFLSILGAMVVFATLYDAFVVQSRTKVGDEKPIAKHANASKPNEKHASESQNGIEPTKKSYINGGYLPTEPDEKMHSIEMKETNMDSVKTLNGTIGVPMESLRPEPKAKREGIAERICLAFSVYSNGVKLLSANQGTGSLGAVNGVRFLSMAWVIFGHTYFFAWGYDDNFVAYLYTHLNDWDFMAMPYATVSVDSFFTLSGILVAYLTLRELKKVGGGMKMNWFMFYFHRFWRLTPPYMLVLMVGTVILPYITEGPMSSNEDLPYMEGCRTKWWANLLYVNNYVTEDTCMGWSWYLANDMQFYIISPLILLPFFYNAVAGAVVSGAFLVATVTATGVVAKKHEYPVQMFSPFQHLPKDKNYSKNLYLPSYARMGPYIVGLVTGYLLYRLKCKCKIPRKVNVVCWLLCIGTTCAIIYGEYTHGDSHIMSLWENVIFMAINRTAWGMAIGWIIFACATGNGGWINELLSWKPYIPLGRLTYCAYLVHPLVMLVYYMSRRSPVYFTHFEAAYLFIANLVMSYGVAFVTSLFFESPMMGLEKAILHKSKK